MKSIKELADELGYSKTYISQTIKNNGLQSSLRKIGNKFAIDEELEIALKEILSGESQTEERKRFANKTQTENNDFFAFFKDQLKEKDKQLSKKDEQIFELNERLRETIIMLNDSRKELSQMKQSLIEFESQKQDKWWKFWKK
ncbi:hypothetical protein [Streptococcus pluranimalium]|uniref:hypothetical protein n=1 Tax=Streptococcus pluranimalium TaxID=82348 RepID=UPI003138DAB8